MSFPDSFQEKDQVNILFLDVSSTCTGYSIAECNFTTRTATIIKAGVLWLNPNWPHQEKYHYIQKAIETYFWIVQKIDFIVTEGYRVNPKQAMGTLVVPEMLGAIKSGAQENGISAETNIAPSSWRKNLGVKADKDEKGKSDWKSPVKRKILEMVDIPEKVVSNITGSLRATPSDLYDAIGIGYGWLKQLKGADKTSYFTNILVSKDLIINEHIGVINEV